MKHHFIQFAAIVLCVIKIVSSEEYECKPDKIFPMKDADLIKVFKNTWRVQTCTPGKLCDNVACSDYTFTAQSDIEFEIQATAFNESTGRDTSFVGLGTVTGPGEVYLQFALEFATRKDYMLATDYVNYYLIFTWLPDVFGNVIRTAFLLGKTNEPLPFVRSEIAEALKMNNLEWDDLKQRKNENCPPIE